MTMISTRPTGARRGSRITLRVVGLALLAALLAAPGTGASAADDADTVAARQAAAVAPSCVLRWVNDNGYIDVLDLQNTCGYGLWLKAVVAWGEDSPCSYLANGRLWRGFWQWTYPGRLDRLERC